MLIGNQTSFQCFKCRTKKGAVYGSYSWEIYHNRGTRSRITLTGKKRPRRQAPALGSMMQFDRQYKCNDCKHIGWSRHYDLELEERLLTTEPNS